MNDDSKRISAIVDNVSTSPSYPLSKPLLGTSSTHTEDGLGKTEEKDTKDPLVRKKEYDKGKEMSEKICDAVDSIVAAVNKANTLGVLTLFVRLTFLTDLEKCAGTKNHRIWYFFAKSESDEIEKTNRAFSHAAELDEIDIADKTGGHPESHCFESSLPDFLLNFEGRLQGMDARDVLARWALWTVETQHFNHNARHYMAQLYMLD